MRPTREWMQRVFAFYNKKYFGGRIPTPEMCVNDNFKLNNGADAWGAFDINASYNKNTGRIFAIRNNGKITMSAKYSRNETDLIETMLHEMAHAYVYTVEKYYNPNDIHGGSFQRIAKFLMGEGWDILSDEIKSTDTLKKDSKQKQNQLPNRVLCLFSKVRNVGYKYWCCVIDRADINKCYLEASRIKGVSKIVFLECPSGNLNYYKPDIETLRGFGSSKLVDIQNNMAEYFNTSPDVFDFKKMKQVK